MAESMSVEIRAFSRTLAETSREARSMAKDATVKATFDILNGARLDAPVDTGYMRASGTVNMSLGDVVSGEVTFSAEYAIFVEEGTSKMAGRPFLRPNFEKYSAEWVKALEQIGGLVIK